MKKITTKSLQYFVFAGCASRIMYHVAAMDELCVLLNITHEDIKGCAGASIGALMAAAIVNGVAPKALLKDIYTHDKIGFNTLINFEITDFFNNWALDNGQLIEKFIATYVPADETFVQMFHRTRKILHVVTHNLNKQQEMVFNYINTPNVLVARAIRMSMTLPGIFKPCMYKNDYHVDGGFSNNFPINLFDANKVFGINILTKNKEHTLIDSWSSYYGQIVRHMSETMINNQVLSDKYKERTIVLHTYMTNFDGDVTSKMYNLMNTEARIKIREFIKKHDLHALQMYSFNKIKICKETKEMSTQTETILENETFK